MNPIHRHHPQAAAPQRERPVRHRLAVATLLVLGALTPWAQQLAQAQAVVPSATAPSGKKSLIDSASNGVPIVNIAPPSTGGVSHNLFTSFNTNANGVIVNNRSSAGASLLGGTISGNPQLGPTAARLVLAEVNSTNASSLLGRLEIAGTGAEFVLANPNGITCNGCGFINTSRAVLASGVPDWLGGVSGGTLNGYSITGGSVQVGAAGMNVAGLADVSLLGGQISITGRIDDGGTGSTSVFAIAGANRVDHLTLQTSPLARSNALPINAVDVASVGSINANQIYLVTTEAATGLQHAGTATARAGGITLDAAGNLSVTGTLRTSAGGAIVAAAQGIDVATSNGAGSGSGGIVDAPAGLVLLQARADASLRYAGLSGSDVMVAAGGLLRAEKATITATQDVRLAADAGEMDVLAGSISAGRGLTLSAGSHLNLRAAEATGTQTTTLNGTTTTTTTTLYDKPLLNAKGDISISSANGGITLDGVSITAAGSMGIQGAGIQVLARKNLVSEVSVSGSTTTKPSTQDLIPTDLNAGGDLSIIATGKTGSTELGNIFISGASVQAGTGQLSLMAARDIDIAHDTTTDTDYSEYYAVKRRLFSKTVTREIKTNVKETLKPSELGGATISIGAGGNLSIVASTVQADGAISASADGDLSLLSAGASSYAYTDRTVKKSGIFGSGSFGITIGSRSTTELASQQSTQQLGTEFSSLFGDVSLSAGKQYLQMSSSLIAPLGNVAVSGQDLAFQTNNNTSSDFSLIRTRQWGLTFAAGHPWVSTAQATVDALKKADATDSGQHKALAYLSGALGIYNAFFPPNAATEKAPPPPPTAATAWTLSATLGNQASSFESMMASTVPVESVISAGRDVNLTAWGTGVDSGSITALGSAISAGNNATLRAARDINLLAAIGNSSESTKSSSSSGAIGLSFDYTSSSLASINLAASRSRAWSNGWGTTYYDSQVGAGQLLDMASGRDTTLGGAKASGTTVLARVGTAGAGNLTVASPQDESHFSARDTNTGFSLSFSPSGVPTAISASYANAKLLADWQSAREQSAIVAGTGGFDISVAGHTHLRGGALSSESSLNRATTQTFSHESLVNRDNVSGSATNISLSLSIDPATKPGLGGSSIGWANIDRASLGATVAAVSPGTYSITRPDLNAAAIAALRAAERDPLVARRSTAQLELGTLLTQEPPKYPGQVVYGTQPVDPSSLSATLGRLDTGEEPTAVLGSSPTPEWSAWKARVDQLTTTVAGLTTRINASDARVLQDASTLSGNVNASHQPLPRVFDTSRATAQLKLDAAITAAFGREAYKTVGTVADALVKAEIAKCTAAGNPDATRCTAATYWAEGGRYRTLVHAAVGGASFGAAGAAGVVASSAAQSVLGDALNQQLNAAGIYDQATINALRSVISVVAGAAAGGAAGAASGLTVDANNRQLHPAESAYLKAKAAAWQLLRPGITLAQAEQELTRGALFDNDLKWQQSLKDWTPDQVASYRLAADYLRTQAAGDGFKFLNLDGIAQAGFTSTQAQFLNAKYLLAQAWQDQTTRALYQDRAAIKLAELGAVQSTVFGVKALYGVGEGLPEGIVSQLKFYRDTLDPATFKRLADAADQVRRQGLSATLDKLYAGIVGGAQDAAMGVWMSWLQADSRALGQSAGRVIGAGAVDAAALSLGIAIIQKSGAVAAGLTELQSALARTISAEKQAITANVQALATVQPAAARVMAGVEMHPGLGAPVAGWDYMPSVVSKAATENGYWSHVTGLQAELRLANEVATSERVVKWGDKVGRNGSDIVSVNALTGEVTLWDSKFLSGERRIGESTTFSGSSTRIAATDEAISAIRQSSLDAAAKQTAISNLQNGKFTTKTVGSGGAKNSVVQRYCGSSPC